MLNLRPFFLLEACKFVRNLSQDANTPYSSNCFNFMVYILIKYIQYLRHWKCKNCAGHCRKQTNLSSFTLDCMFASASLDGAIVLWSSHSISYTRQFNFVKNYEGPNHTYPASAQHVFTVDQVRRKLKCLFSLFFILLSSVYVFDGFSWCLTTC